MNWYADAACRGMDPELFYPARQPGARRDYSAARQVCDRCPVVAECLEEAMRLETRQDYNGRFGIWGGLTPRQRIELMKARRR